MTVAHNGATVLHSHLSVCLYIGTSLYPYES